MVDLMHRFMPARPIRQDYMRLYISASLIFRDFNFGIAEARVTKFAKNKLHHLLVTYAIFQLMSPSGELFQLN